MTDALRQQAEVAMHVLTSGGDTVLADQAVIYVYEGLGYGIVGALRWAPLRWLTPTMYGLVANNRRSFAPWFFRGD